MLASESAVYDNTLTLDANFAPFLVDQATWGKKTNTSPLRDLRDDSDDTPGLIKRTAQQKVAHLELMLGQIANFCPIISRNTIVKNSTSMNSIWQAIRLHLGFQTSGAHFLDFADLKLEPDENNEDLFQRLMAFVDDNLMTVGGGISHHDEFPAVDEDLSPSLENMIVLHWLKLIHQDLPRLVKQRYGSELRSRTLASLKPEIYQVISSLMDEIHSISETKIMRQATYNHPRRPTRSGPARYHPQNKRTQLATKQCPLCKQAGRTVYDHYLSTCKYLPEHDRLYISSTRIVTGLDNNDSAEDEQQLLNDSYDQTQGVSMTCRVNTKQSPFFKAFYLHNPLRLTLDSGAETNMIRET